MNRFLIVLTASINLLPASVAADGAYRSDVLTRSTLGWDGVPFHYPAGQGELTMTRVTMPRGHLLPMHCHPMPVVGYVASGELRVTTDSGDVSHYTAGSGVIEVFQSWHEGEALADSELVIVYAGAEGQDLTLPRSGGRDCRGDDEAAIEQALNAFLAGASINDRVAHDRFWADDLVYTSSDGTRRGKAEILAGMGPAPDEEASVTWSAEDVDIRLYGSTAVLAFRLRGRFAEPGAADLEALNTGTLVKRAGRWQVVAWQATRVPAATGED